MTVKRDFKDMVRARAAKMGESFSTARRRLLAEPPPRRHRRRRQRWSIAEMMSADKQARDGAPCVKAPFATEATEDELTFGFVECAIPNPLRMAFEPSRVKAVAVEFHCM